MEETAEGPTYRIPQSRRIGEELVLDEGLPRPEFVQQLKGVIQREREAIRRVQIDQINEITGMDVAGMLTGMTDAVVDQAARRAFDRAGAPSDWPDSVGIFALGSYGRGELAPHSDIDLTVLYAGRGSRPDWVASGGQELQTLLWDLGFKVGGSQRAVSELDAIIANDFVTATAVLEQRPVVAGEAVTDALRAVRERFGKKRSNPFLRYKVEELQERRQRAGNNLFRLEPDLKVNPGCLRDVQFLRNAIYVALGSRNLHALRDLDVIGWNDVQQLFAANDHLLGMRALLHFHHEREQDVLHLTDQLWMAELLGYARGGQLLAVEHMMRLHYEKCLHVHQMVDLTISRLRALGHIGRRRLLIKTRRRVDEDFSVVGGAIYVNHRDFWRKPDLGLRLMRMFRSAQQRKVGVSLELQRDIAAHHHLLQFPSVRRDPEIARVFLEILGDLGKVRPVLEDMHWSGFLGAYLPEFGRLTCHMQFNSYHQYTVDEHTLIAIGNIDEVVTGGQPGLPGMPEMLRQAERPDLLNLGLLLHDAGKFMGSGHVKRGAMMVGPIADRMGLDEDEEDLVHFLIDQHVSLSDASRSRDIHDPTMLGELARAMGDQSRLDLLYCLTYADARAVGEGILTGWQEAILAELHDSLRRELRSMTGQGVISRPELIRNELRDDGLDEAAVDAFLARMGEGYDYQVARGEAPLHRRLIEAAAESGFAFAREVQGEAVTVTFAAVNRVGLLGDIAAALTGNSLEVVESRIWTTTDALVLHSHRVVCDIPSAIGDPETWSRIERNVRAAVEGSIDPAELLARREMRLVTDAPADSGFREIDVRIDQDNSQDATIFDVNVKDRVGLLYELCTVIAGMGCQIEYASIATFGDIARDAFYVTMDGEKLGHGQAIRLRNALSDRLRELAAEDDRRTVGSGAYRI